MLKIKEVNQVFRNNKAVTIFQVFEKRGDAWVFDYQSLVSGHWKKTSTIARKHCEECGGKYEAKNWEN